MDYRLHLLVLSCGLVAVEAGAILGWGFRPNGEQLRDMANFGFTIGSISIGVVGILLSLFMTQGIGTKSEGPIFRVLIVCLTGASVIALASGFTAFVAAAGVGPCSLGEYSLYGLLAAVYAAAMGTVLTAIEILS